MTDERKHDQEHRHDHEHEAHDHAHETGHGHHQHEHGHEAHGHKHGHSHEHGHGHGGHEHKTHFHDPQHAADFDRRTSRIRAELADKLAEMLVPEGNELILDLATGTGRVARPVAKRLKGGRIVGADEAPGMLDVGHRHSEPIPPYYPIARARAPLPFKSHCLHL